jgi:hypothetical protein
MWRMRGWMNAAKLTGSRRLAACPISGGHSVIRFESHCSLLVIGRVPR